MPQFQEPLHPVVLDLGKVRRKAVRRLKRGTGALVTNVQQAIAEARRQLGAEGASKEVLPVVLIYERKRKRRQRTRFPLPMMF